MMQTMLIFLGLAIAAATLASILWSIAVPDRRIWPPRRYTVMTPVLVWVPTLSLFGILIVLGIWGWGGLALAGWLRFGVGIPLILVGNLVVWSEVTHFGLPQTSGAIGTLRTEGMYRYSRNPQYTADIGIIAGWILLSSAPWALFIGTAAILVLFATPFAEEPWLQDKYGAAFDEYRASARRFI
jgi:protein-S-isoprenylcysteine O-methyltransferase Ste14